MDLIGQFQLSDCPIISRRISPPPSWRRIPFGWVDGNYVNSFFGIKILSGEDQGKLKANFLIRQFFIEQNLHSSAFYLRRPQDDILFNFHLKRPGETYYLEIARYYRYLFNWIEEPNYTFGVYADKK